MPDRTDFAFLYVETALCAGTPEPGRGVDVPIQRDETGTPIVPGSSLRGSILAAAKQWRAKEEIVWAFGSPPGVEPHTEGVLRFNPAQLILFPVRTYKGIFAWITSPRLLTSFRTAAADHGLDLPLPSILEPGEHEAVVAQQAHMLTARNSLIIEDFSFPARPTDEVAALGEWFAEHAMPQDEACGFFRQRMRTGIALLPDDACDFLLRHRTPATWRVAIDPQTGTAQQGALWAEESLPSESLLYTLVGAAENSASPPPVPVHGLSWLKALDITSLQVGSNLTLGAGFVRWTWLNGART